MFEIQLYLYIPISHISTLIYPPISELFFDLTDSGLVEYLCFNKSKKVFYIQLYRSFCQFYYHFGQ